MLSRYVFSYNMSREPFPLHLDLVRTFAREGIVDGRMNGWMVGQTKNGAERPLRDWRLETGNSRLGG